MRFAFYGTNIMKQRTIKNTVALEGIGLQTGSRTRLTFKGSSAGSGIEFVRTDLADRPSLNLRSIDLTGSASRERRTALSIGPMEIQTIEHLLAALSGLSIDNIIVELDNVELPGLDGSALSFTEAIKKAGIVEQDEPRKVLKIEEPIWVREKDSFLGVFPGEGFNVSYTLSYERPALGTQYFSADITEENFVKEIAPARTFCLEEEAAELLKRGLGKGANYENTLVMGKSGPLNNKLRFPNEPVRHKVLDLIGDLYLLGMKIEGNVVAIKSGHKLNMEMVKKLRR